MSHLQDQINALLPDNTEGAVSVADTRNSFIIVTDDLHIKDGLIAGKEAALGNPTIDGQVLSSTILGARTWVDLLAGPTGPQGEPGIDGINGTNGLDGADGADSTVPGPAGSTGPQGTAATIAVGAVSGVQEGGTPTVTNAGTNEEAIFDFGLTVGNTGATGTQGIDGPTGAQGEQGISGIDGADSVVPGPVGPEGPRGYGTNILGVAALANIIAHTAGTIGEAYVTNTAGVDTNGTAVEIDDVLRATDTAVPSTWVTIGAFKGETGAPGTDGADSVVPGPDGAIGPEGPEGPAGTGINVLGIESSAVVITFTAVAVGDSYVSNDVGVDSEGSVVAIDDVLRATDIAVPSNWVTIGPIQGPKGDTGTQGIQGDTGIQGPIGPDGVQGIQGPIGSDGADSVVPGPQGDPGPQGNDGADSIVPGPTGADGPQGIQGVKGLGWTSGIYNAPTGIVSFASTDGLEFVTGDLRGAEGTVGDQGPQGVPGTGLFPQGSATVAELNAFVADPSLGFLWIMLDAGTVTYGIDPVVVAIDDMVVWGEEGSFINFGSLSVNTEWVNIIGIPQNVVDAYPNTGGPINGDVTVSGKLKADDQFEVGIYSSTLNSVIIFNDTTGTITGLPGLLWNNVVGEFQIDPGDGINQTLIHAGNIPTPDLSQYVDITSDQLINGVKTWNDNAVFKAVVDITSNLDVGGIFTTSGVDGNTNAQFNGGIVRMTHSTDVDATARGFKFVPEMFDARSEIGAYGNGGGGLAIGGNNTGSGLQTVSMFFNPADYNITLEHYNDTSGLIEVSAVFARTVATFNVPIVGIAPTDPSHLARLENVNTKETGLGVPTSDGFVLSSTIAGVRTWVTPQSGPQGIQGEVGPAGADGADGATGPTGAAATIAVGTVIGTAPGVEPTIVDSGVPGAAIFDFTLEQGAQGTIGNTGPVGADGADSIVPGPEGPIGPQGVAGPGTNILGQDTTVAIVAKTAVVIGDAYVTTDGGVDSEGSTVILGDLLRATDTVVPSNWVTLGPIQGPQGVQGVQGDVGPAGADGADSVVPGPTGPAGTDGADSIVPGPEGAAGATGADGPIGPDGPQGVAGVDGKTWFTDIIDPIAADGVDGDLWQNTVTNNYWTKAAGVWTDQGSIVGPAGATGADGATGGVGPAGADGADSVVPGPTGPAGTDGADSVVPGPQGEIGPTGPAGAEGTEGPTAISGDAGNIAELGVDNLIYIDAVTSDADGGGSVGGDKVTEMVSLTQVEYDAIVTKVPTAFYIIVG